MKNPFNTQFKDYTNEQLYWFAVHFLNGAENTKENAKVWAEFMSEVTLRDKDTVNQISYLMEVI